MASQGTLRLFFFAAFAFFSLILAKECKKIDTCSCIMDDGTGIISLHAIDNNDGTPSFKGIVDTVQPTYTFSWNPCTPLKARGACQGSNACLYTPDQYPVGNPDTTFSINTDGTVLLTYGKVTYDSYTRAFKVTLKCDARAEGTFGEGISEVDGSTGSTYTGTFTSRCACPGACRMYETADHKNHVNVIE